MGRSSKVMRVCAALAALSVSIVCIGCQNSSSIEVATEAMVETALSDADIKIEDVAAVVSGRIITHQQVDEAIAADRARSGFEGSQEWGAYLRSAGLTDWDVRATVIHRMIDNALVELEADRLGIDVEQAVASRMAALEALYPTRQTFLSAIEDKGYTEESYTQAVRQNLLWEALCAAIIPTPEPTSEQISQYAVAVAPTLCGKRSSHILFSVDDYQTASEVYRMLGDGADFAELAAVYSIDSTASAGGDVGWDSLNTFIPPYQHALDQLEPGEYSDIILTRFGYHIILCTDEYTAPTDALGNIDLEAIPDDLMDVIVHSMGQTMTSELFTRYICNLEAVTPIAVFDGHGVQIPNAEVGLATEVVDEEPTPEEVIEGVIADVHSLTQTAVDQIAASFRLSLGDDELSADVSSVHDAEDVVNSAVEHSDFAAINGPVE